MQKKVCYAIFDSLCNNNNRKSNKLKFHFEI